MAVMALGLITTLEDEEQPRSARHNRCRGAHEAILKVCDIYVPGGMDQVALSRIWDLVDGPVMAAIRDNQQLLLAAGNHITEG